MTLIIYLGPTSLLASSDLPTIFFNEVRTSSHYHAFCATDSLFGLSTRKVYRASSVAAGAVSSYLTISPLPRRWRGGIFSVALAVSRLSVILLVKKYGALCCPDFPPRQRRGDKTACIFPFLFKYLKFYLTILLVYVHSR